MAGPLPSIVFLHEWFATAEKVQNNLIKDLGWPPQKANRIWHRLQPLRDNEIAEIAEFLNVRPYEMLMHPSDAMRFRRIEATINEVGPPTTPTPTTTPAPALRKPAKRAAAG